MVVIDITILNVALPTLVVDLQTSMGEMEWALIAYTLALTGLIPLFGRISDVFGRKRLFIAGLLCFSAGSLLAGLATSIGGLIGARVVQALGGALITSNSLAIITDTFPAGQRGVAMGIQSILISGGAAVGPTLGGFLVTHYGWQWVFYINLPIGAAAALLAAVVLPPLQSHRTLEPVDWLGGLTLTGGLTLLLLGVTRGPAWGWDAPRTLFLSVGGALALALFVWRELRTAYPLVELALFRTRDFTAGQLAGVFATIALSGSMFLLPFYWQGLRGLSAQATGLMMLPIPVTFMVVAPLAGRLSDLRGGRWLSGAGLLVVMAGLFVLSRLTAQMAPWDVVWRLVVFGFGLALFMSPNNNVVMSAVPAGKRGIAAGLLGMFRYTGQSLGVAFGGTILAHHLGGAVPAGTEGIPSPEVFAGLAANPAALATFRAAFEAGMATVFLWAIPLVGVGAVLSLLLGFQPAPSGVRQLGPG